MPMTYAPGPSSCPRTGARAPRAAPAGVMMIIIRIRIRIRIRIVTIIYIYIYI